METKTIEELYKKIQSIHDGSIFKDAFSINNPYIGSPEHKERMIAGELQRFKSDIYFDIHLILEEMAVDWERIGHQSDAYNIRHARENIRKYLLGK